MSLSGTKICELVPQLEYNIKLKLNYLLFYKCKGAAMSEVVTVKKTSNGSNLLSNGVTEFTMPYDI